MMLTLVCVNAPVMYLLCVARDYSLHTVAITEAGRVALRERFRHEENSEGAVVYVLSKQACGRVRVCRIYKYKNDDYVFRRAVRYAWMSTRGCACIVFVPCTDSKYCFNALHAESK